MLAAAQVLHSLTALQPGSGMATARGNDQHPRCCSGQRAGVLVHLLHRQFHRVAALYLGRAPIVLVPLADGHGHHVLSNAAMGTRWYPHLGDLFRDRYPALAAGKRLLIRLVRHYWGYVSARYWITAVCSFWLSWAPIFTMRSTFAFHPASVFLARSTRPRLWHSVHRS